MAPQSKPQADGVEPKPDVNMIETAKADALCAEKGVLGAELDYSGAVKKTSQEEIRLVRKLDYRIMPTLWAMYFLNYVRSSSLQAWILIADCFLQLDRNAIAQARLNGLEDDLRLKGTEYNTCISVLFVG